MVTKMSSNSEYFSRSKSLRLKLNLLSWIMLHNDSTQVECLKVIVAPKARKTSTASTTDSSPTEEDNQSVTTSTTACGPIGSPQSGPMIRRCSSATVLNSSTESSSGDSLGGSFLLGEAGSILGEAANHSGDDENDEEMEDEEKCVDNDVINMDVDDFKLFSTSRHSAELPEPCHMRARSPSPNFDYYDYASQRGNASDHYNQCHYGNFPNPTVVTPSTAPVPFFDYQQQCWFVPVEVSTVDGSQILGDDSVSKNNDTETASGSAVTGNSNSTTQVRPLCCYSDGTKIPDTQFINCTTSTTSDDQSGTQTDFSGPYNGSSSNCSNYTTGNVTDYDYLNSSNSTYDWSQTPYPGVTGPYDQWSQWDTNNWRPHGEQFDKNDVHYRHRQGPVCNYAKHSPNSKTREYYYKTNPNPNSNSYVRKISSSFKNSYNLSKKRGKEKLPEDYEHFIDVDPENDKFGENHGFWSNMMENGTGNGPIEENVNPDPESDEKKKTIILKHCLRQMKEKLKEEIEKKNQSNHSGIDNLDESTSLTSKLKTQITNLSQVISCIDNHDASSTNLDSNGMLRQSSYDTAISSDDLTVIDNLESESVTSIENDDCGESPLATAVDSIDSIRMMQKLHDKQVLENRNLRYHKAFQTKLDKIKEADESPQSTDDISRLNDHHPNSNSKLPVGIKNQILMKNILPSFLHPLDSKLLPRQYPITDADLEAPYKLVINDFIMLLRACELDLVWIDDNDISVKFVKSKLQHLLDLGRAKTRKPIRDDWREMHTYRYVKHCRMIENQIRKLLNENRNKWRRRTNSSRKREIEPIAASDESTHAQIKEPNPCWDARYID